MSEKDLIPLNKRPIAEARAIQSKGGRTKSPQKKLAAQLRELKKKEGLDNQSIKKIITIIEDSTCSALDIKLFIDEIKKIELKKDKIDTAMLNQLANTYIRWHKAHHGEKTLNLHAIDINIHTTSERFKQFKEKEEEWEKMEQSKN